jgi:hypothetical protein
VVQQQGLDARQAWVADYLVEPTLQLPDVVLGDALASSYR